MWLAITAANRLSAGSSDFMPHGYCYLWDLDSVAACHLRRLITLCITHSRHPIYFIRKNRDLPSIGFSGCSAHSFWLAARTHLMEIWNVWHGSYMLAGVVKGATAAVSVLHCRNAHPIGSTGDVTAG